MNGDSRGSGAIPGPRTRVTRRRDDARARITRAAAALFAGNGFAETSMATIAARADVSVGTLYSFFDGKDALYRELLHAKAVAFRERLLPPLENPGHARTSLEAYFNELLMLYRDEAAFIRFYLRMFGDARLSLRASFSEDTRAIYDDVLEHLAALIERGTVDRSFTGVVDSVRTAVALQAAANELFLLHLDAPERHTADAVLEELFVIIAHRMGGLATAGVSRGGAAKELS